MSRTRALSIGIGGTGRATLARRATPADRARVGSGLGWLAGWPALTGVLVVAFAARVFGLGYGLPHSFYADETKVSDATVAIAATGDLNPIHFFYPTFWLYVLAALLKLGTVLAVPFQRVGPAEAVSLGESSYVFWTLRGATAASGVLSVAVLYLVGRRLFAACQVPWPRAYALAAAGFLALSPLHVQHSHIASPDVPMTLFITVAAYFVLRIVEEGRARWYVLAGVATGLAAGVKYPGATFALAIVLAHVSGCPVASRQPRRMLMSAAFDVRLWLAGLATIGSFAATSPYIILDAPRFLSSLSYEVDKQLARGKSGEFWESGPLAALAYAPEVWRWGLDLPVAILALLGLGWACWQLATAPSTGTLPARSLRSLLVIVAYPLAIYVFSWTWQIRWGRYLLPTIPFACLLAALGAAWLSGRLATWWQGAGAVDGMPRSPFRSGWQAPALSVAVVLGPLLWQADGVLRFDHLLRQPDTRTVAADWITANLPRGQTIVTEWYGPPHPDARSRGLDLSDDPLDRYRRRGTRYIATSSYVYRRWLTDPEQFPKRARFYGSLDSEATLLFEALPEPNFGYDPTQDGWRGWHGIPLDADARPGPIIRIYQILPD